MDGDFVHLAANNNGCSSMDTRIGVVGTLQESVFPQQE